MASIIAMTIEGHLQQLFHMLAYLRIKYNSSMVFDPIEPDIDNSHFVFEDWPASAYSECKDEIPPNAPQPKIIGFAVILFVDSNHAGELTTR